jgi:hypothetical protein
LSQIVHTIDGPGVLVDVDSFHGSTQYRVAGNGFEGWYSSREILSEIDDTTTDINFSEDTDPDGSTTQYLDENDPNQEDGVELPWDPEPTDEFDGELNIQPESHDVSLDPTNSTEGTDFSDDPEFVNTVFPREGAVSEENDDFDGDGPWHYDASLNEWVEGEEPEDEGYADHRVHQSATGPTPGFLRYLAFLEKDPMARQAAWADVRKKAKRLLDDGNVQVRKNNGRECVAVVLGDNGNYNTQVDRKNAHAQTVSYWNCGCPWGAWAYRRQRTFVGRMCSHALATYYAMQSNAQPDPYPLKNRTSGPDRQSVTAESRAAREGGLMVWDDDLSKVLKPLFNGGQPPAGSGGPATPQMGGPTDPAAMGMDPAAMGMDPAAAGQPGVEQLVRQDQQPMPVMATTDYPTRRVRRHQFAEFQDNPEDEGNNFAEWPAPNSQDFDTFNDVDELPEDNDGEEEVWNKGWNRSSAYDEADQQYYDYLYGTGDYASPEHPDGQTTVDTLRGVIPQTPEYADYNGYLDQIDPRHAALEDVTEEPGEEDHDWRPMTKEEALEYADERENRRQAAAFNSQADDLVENFRSRTAGKNFSYAEQQELIDEDGEADQLPNLDLSGTFYE